MKKRFLSCLAIKVKRLLLFSFLITTSIQGQVEPQDIFLKYYEKRQEGDKLLSNGRKKESEEKFKEAQILLQIIQKRFPNWEHSLMQTHSHYLESKIGQHINSEEELAKTEEQFFPSRPKIFEIEIFSRINMPFDENKIKSLLSFKKGERYDLKEIEKTKEVILQTGSYSEVKIEKTERRSLDGEEQGCGVTIVVTPNISDQEVEAYFNKSRRPENLTPKKAFWGKYYYSNQDGIEIIPAEFEEAYPFQGEYACVKQNGKYGLINAKGEFVVSPIYSEKISFDSVAKTVTTPKGVRLNTSRLPDKAEEVRKAGQQPRINERGEEVYQINPEDSR